MTRRALILAVVLLAPFGVRAEDASLMQKGYKILEAENAECDFSVSNYGVVSEGKPSQATQTRTYQFWVYSTESCNQGNNWAGRIGAFRITGDRLVRVDTERFSWSHIKGVDFNNQL